MAAILFFFEWPVAFSMRVGLTEYACQISSLYHNLKDYISICSTKVAAILKKWAPSWIFEWPVAFSIRLALKEYVCQISSLYHNLKDYYFRLLFIIIYHLSAPPYMLYLKNRNGYRHVLGTKISAIPNFIFNFNTFMGLKINAF